MNTMLKPRMNISELRITLGISPLPPKRSSSTPTPEISDTYPGTRGNTQGDKNETSPATNAAMGDTEDIVTILFPPTRLGYAASTRRSTHSEQCLNHSTSSRTGRDIAGWTRIRLFKFIKMQSRPAL